MSETDVQRVRCAIREAADGDSRAIDVASRERRLQCVVQELDIRADSTLHEIPGRGPGVGHEEDQASRLGARMEGCPVCARTSGTVQQNEYRRCRTRIARRDVEPAIACVTE